jgi:bifunctional DNA-binding transcriptional regulator/antitoxin component of YhaV-PrlF toxin-antitoxin module
MVVTYSTEVIGEGNHASLTIPAAVLTELGTNRRAPLIITINEHAYRSTAVGVDGECRVVFPHADRAAANVTAGDTVVVHLELDSGHREVELHPELHTALFAADLREKFESLNYSRRREFARQVAEAKADDTRQRRIDKVVSALLA